MKRLILVFAVIVLLELIGIGAWCRFGPKHTLSPLIQQENGNAEDVDLSGYPVVMRRFVSDGVQRVEKLPNNSNGVHWNQLGDLWFSSGCYQQASSCYAQALECQQDSAKFAYDHAFCLSCMGELDQSNAMFEQAMELEPRLHDSCHYYYGINALRIEDADAAREAFQQSETLAASRIQLAVLDIHDGDLKSAEKRLRTLLAELPNAYRAHQLLSEVLQRTGRADEAYAEAQLAELLDGMIPGPWTERATLLVVQTSDMGVKTQFKKAVEKIRAGRITGLRQELEADQQEFWTPELEDALADLEIAEGDVEGHITRIQRMIDRDGATTYRLARLGFALLTAGKKAEGKAALEAGYRILPSSLEDEGDNLCLRLAELEDAENKTRTAAMYRATATRLQGLRLLGDRRMEMAKVAFNESLKHDSTQGNVWYWLGRTQHLTKDKELAAKSYKKCLALIPTHEDAQRFAKEIETRN